MADLKKKHSWLSYPPGQCLVMARSEDDRIPTVCRKNAGCIMHECASRWDDLPEVIDIDPRGGNKVFGGWCGKNHIVVSAWMEERWASVICHEYVHAMTGWTDHSTKAFKDMEIELFHLAEDYGGIEHGSLQGNLYGEIEAQGIYF